jgi:hypothetical protein
MNTIQHILSGARINRIKVQGYSNYSDTELSALAFGNRFAFIICSTILAIGVTTANIPILMAMTLVAFFGIILLYHPFDYIYNHVLRSILNKPELPPRSKQLKFACLIATLWLIATIYLFYSDLFIAGYVVGGLLFSVAFLVSTTDYCIPSKVYNFIFKYEG